MPTQQKNKKRKRRDFDGTRSNTPQTRSNTKHVPSPPPTKRQKVNKRSSKKPVVSAPTQPNSHVTITFANINGTIDAVILPKQNVLAMTSDVLLENKGKLSIKTSDPIQNDITPQIPIDIKILSTPNIKTIHPRNSFRMGTSLFYCSDEERLFWSFPLRNTRRVSCQHYCTAVSKIVTRSVGIHSNKCNGKHSASTPCIYAVCNGKPPKGIIPAKLFANYQYFQHSAKTELLVQRDPNDEKFKKVENTNNSSTMYSNIKLIQDIGPMGGPPPLAPMESSSKIKNEFESTSRDIKTETNTDTKRRRQQNVNHGEPVPFQQNVQIDLKALSKRKQKLKMNSSCMTTSSSSITEPECHDYSDLLLHSTSSCVRDAQSQSEAQLQSEMTRNCDKISDIKRYIQLLMDGEFDEMITILKPLIPPPKDTQGSSSSKKRKAKAMDQDELNGYRLLMATALYYRDKVGNGVNDSSSALHFCNLVLSNADEGDVRYYEARKIRGLIHKKLRNYKAACHDLEFIAFNNPYQKTWSDTLYGTCGQSNFLENKILSPKAGTRYQPPPPNPYHIDNTRLNEIITHHPQRPPPVLPNPAYYHMQPMPMPNNAMFGAITNQRPSLDPAVLKAFATNMVNNAMNPNNRIAMDISDPGAPIIFIPPIMDRASGSGTTTPSSEDRRKANKLGINLDHFHAKPGAENEDMNHNKSPPKSASSVIDPALLDVRYTDMLQIGDPKGFPERQTSNTSFDGLIALAQAASTEYDDKKENEKKDDNEQKETPDTVLNADDLLKDLGGFEAMTRKTTREELLGDYRNGSTINVPPSRINTKELDDGQSIDNSNKNITDYIPNMASLQRRVSTTPEPLERIRSDALARNDSQ
eukprot:403884_1